MASNPKDDIRRVEQRGTHRTRRRSRRVLAIGATEAQASLRRMVAQPEARENALWWLTLVSIVAITLVRTIHSHPEWSWFTIVAFFAGLFYVGGIFAAVNALLTAQSSQASIAWCISLVTFPYLSVPLYLVLGRNRLQGYKQAFGAGRLPRSGEIADIVIRPMRAFPPHNGNHHHEVIEVLENLARVPFTGHNRTTLLVDGEEAYAAMFGAIEQAERYVLVFFFIINDDGVGRALHTRLIERARAGVQVVVVYDDWGSWWLTRRYIDELKAAGVEVAAFTSGEGLYNKLQMNFRNHRKSIVIDGRLAFVGGLNVGDEQLGIDRYYGPWRDTHICLEGPAVQGVQLVFQEDYHWASGGKRLALDWEPHDINGDVAALYLSSGPTEDIQAGLLYFLHLINSARHRLWLSSPYFVPDQAILEALKLADLRGVDVRILLPDRSDHWYMDLAARAYLRELRAETSVKIFLHPHFAHQKVVLVDDWLSAIGSANLDNRSMRLNFEGNMLIVSRSFAAEISQMLSNDFARAREPGPEEINRMRLQTHVGAKFCRLFDQIL